MGLSVSFETLDRASNRVGEVISSNRVKAVRRVNKQCETCKRVQWNIDCSGNIFNILAVESE